MPLIPRRPARRPSALGPRRAARTSPLIRRIRSNLFSILFLFLLTSAQPRAAVLIIGPPHLAG